MEEKLNEFRRRKRKEKIWDTLMLKGVMEKLKSTPTSPSSSMETSPAASPTPLLAHERVFSEDNISVISIASSNSSGWSPDPTTLSKLTLVTYGLYALLWTTVLILAMLNGFGAVYFVLSGLVGIYLNTRTGPRKEGEVSAYSVFNPNCVAIDGTLKAEQFEREFNLIKHSPS